MKIQLLTRALIYLSFFSFPNIEKEETLYIIASYIGIIFANAFILFILNSRIRKVHFSHKIRNYILLTALLLGINFLIANQNDIHFYTWASRSIHIFMIPFFYISFKFSKISHEIIFKDIAIAGLLETFLIYFTYIFGFSNELTTNTRATTINNTIIYSSFILVAAFYQARLYLIQQKTKYLATYLAILFATFFTESRILIISTGIIALVLNKKKLLLIIGVLVVSFIFLNEINLFERFNLQEESHVVTIQSKIEEIIELWTLFYTAPLFGVGFGKSYQIYYANTSYTYTHNIVMFYLAYSGLIGLFIMMYPFYKLFLVKGYKVLILSLLLFYTSNTTYTNIKHSIIIAFILYLIDLFENQKIYYSQKSNHMQFATKESQI